MHLHWLKAACESCVKNIALVPRSFLHLMSGRNLLGLPERHSILPDGLETESGIHCSDLGGGGLFGRMTEQSTFTQEEN